MSESNDIQSWNFRDLKVENLMLDGNNDIVLIGLLMFKYLRGVT